MIENKYTFTSENKINQIQVFVWSPENTGAIKGILQLSHGMAEHILRYKHFAKYLTSKGYIVCGNDHAGHGKSSNNEFGFMGEEDGYIHMVDDLYKITSRMKKNYPEIPYFLLGHSMGSFLARMYCYYYGHELDGVIFSGTKGTEPFINPGLLISNTFIKLGKGKSIGNILNNLSAKQYNDAFKPTLTNFDWLSRDKNVCKEFEEDPECGFVFTYYGYRDLFNVLKFISSDDWYKNYPKDLPTLIFSGSKDPVGDFSKGVKEVYNKLKNQNVENLTLKLFPEGRHEMLNELNKKEVYDFVLDWLENN